MRFCTVQAVPIEEAEVCFHLGKVYVVSSVAKYKHDCDACEFLGHMNGFDIWRDCNSGTGIILRFSDDGPQYYGVYDSLEQAEGRLFGDKLPEGMTDAQYLEYMLLKAGRRYRGLASR